MYFYDTCVFLETTYNFYFYLCMLETTYPYFYFTYVFLETTYLT